MSELKTLRDMTEYESCEGELIEKVSSDDWGLFKTADLRAEAIKWIREAGELINDVEMGKIGYYDQTNLGIPKPLDGKYFIYHNYGRLVGHEELEAICGFIKHFFNISEEDLKDV